MAWFVDYGGIDGHRPTQTYEDIYNFYSQLYFDKKKAKRLSNLTVHYIKRLKAKGKPLYALYRDFIITTDKYKEGEIVIMKNFYDVMDYVKEVYEDCFCHEDDEETANDFFACPNCGEPIYYSDYPEIEWRDAGSVGNYICPVCENEF